METSVFTEILKTIYKKRDKITQLIEGLENMPQQPLNEYYVKLQIIAKEEDNNMNTRDYGTESMAVSDRHIDLNKLFDGGLNNSIPSKVAQRILVLGEAGVGKSTLLQYMVYKWSIGELWNERFDYVYLIRLKTMLEKRWTIFPYKYSDQDLNESRLRCLAHYSLMLTEEENSTILPQTLGWAGVNKDTSRILLLIDSFDEVSHRWSNPGYKELFDEILEFKNVVLTSRPNTIETKLRANFNQVIENVGLDQQGVEEYLERYFKNQDTKKKELVNFLDQNSLIKDICKVPINISMISYMWMCSENDVRLKNITNISILYQEMINLLSKRFLEKTSKNYDPNAPAKVIEFKILSHAAYKALTGGGVDVEQDDRTATFLIPGVVFRQNASAQSREKMDLEDTDGISLQSSVNYIEKLEYKEGWTTLKSLYKYGLLKVEGSFSKSLKDTSVADLQTQSYSFIHLTFQEYCAACYIKYRLEKGDSKERSEICRFIGEHRNEPRYAMTLKFMTGIITADQNKETQPAVEMFWEAISCNVDGVIEIGIETKAGLILQLLGQANMKSHGIDPRIPNRQEIIDFIDVVVLKDILAFYPQLEESGYMTENIKQGIRENLIDETQAWTISKMKEIAEKSQPGMKAVIENILQELKAQTDRSDVVQSMKYRKIRMRRFIDISKKLFNKTAEGNTKEKYNEYIFEGLSEAFEKYTEKDTEKIELAFEKIDAIILDVNLETQMIKFIKLIELIISKPGSSNAFEITANVLKKMVMRVENSASTCASEILNEIATSLTRINFNITKLLVSSLEQRPMVKELKFKVIDNVISSGDKINMLMRKDLITALGMNVSEKFEFFTKLIPYLTSQTQETRTSAIELISYLYFDDYNGNFLVKYYGNAFDFYHNQEGKVTKDVIINAFMCLTILFQKKQLLNGLFPDTRGNNDINCDIRDEELIKETSVIISKMLNGAGLSVLNHLDAAKIKHYMISFAKKIETAGYNLADQKQVFQNLDALLGTNCAKKNQSALGAYPIFIWMMKTSKELVSQAFRKLICFLIKDDKDLCRVALQPVDKIISYIKEEQPKLEEVFKELIIGLEKRDFRIDQIWKPLTSLLQYINDKQLLKEILFLALNLLGDENEFVRHWAESIFIDASKRIDDIETASACFDSAMNLLKNQNDGVVKAAMGTLNVIIQMTKGETQKDLIYRGIKGLIPFMSEETYKSTAVSQITRLVHLKECNKDFLFEFFEGFVNCFKKDYTLRKQIKLILCEMVKLSNEEFLRRAFDLSKQFLKDHEEDPSVSLKYLFVRITKKADPSLAAVCFEFTEGILQEEDMEVVEHAMSNLQDIIKSAKDVSKPEFISKAIQKLMNFVLTGDDNTKETAVNHLLPIIMMKESNKEIIAFSKELIDTFKKDEALSNLIGNILFYLLISTNKELRKSTMDLSRDLLKDESQNVREAAKNILSSVFCSFQSKIPIEYLEYAMFLLEEEDEDVVQNTIEALFDILSNIEDVVSKEELASSTIQKLLHLLSKENHYMKKSALEVMNKILYMTKDKEIISEAFKRVIALVRNEEEDSDIMESAIYCLLNLIKMAKGVFKEDLASETIKELKNLLSNSNEDIVMLAANNAKKILCLIKDNNMIWELFKAFLSVLKSENSLKSEMKSIISKMVSGLKDKDLLRSILKMIENQYKREGNVNSRGNDMFWFELIVMVNLRRIGNPAVYNVKREYGISDINELVSSFSVNSYAPEQEEEKNFKYLERILGLGEFMKVILEAFKEFVKSLESLVLTTEKDKTRQLLQRALEQFNDEESFKSVLYMLRDFITNEPQKSSNGYFILRKLIEQSENAELAHVLLEFLVDLLQECDTETTRLIMKILISRRSDKNFGNETELILKPIKALHKVISIDKNVFTDAQDINCKNLAAWIASLELPVEISIDYITLSNQVFKASLYYYLEKSFGRYLRKFNTIENFLKKLNFDIQVVDELQFDSDLGFKLKEEIKKHINVLQQENKVVNLNNLKQRMNYIGKTKGFELIEICLFLIGDEHVQAESKIQNESDKYDPIKDEGDLLSEDPNGSSGESDDVIKARLLCRAKQIIELQAENLSSESLVWLNEKLESLSKISKQSKYFFKKIYHKLLENFEITSIEEKLIIKLINLGLIISITRRGEVIFEGKKYLIKGKNAEQVLERISKEVIKQKQDALAIQYEQYEPVFKMISKTGMREASCDIKKVGSLVNKLYELSNEEWLMTELNKVNSQENNKQILIIEQRNTMGDHVIYDLKTQKLFKLNPNNLEEVREMLFGEYDQSLKIRYYGRSKILNNSDIGYEIISNALGSQKEFDSIAGSNLNQGKIYFQQELLNKGHEDRLSWLTSEINMKINNGSKRAGMELSNLTPADRTNLMDYYEAFLKTFTEVYTTAQMMENENLVLDSGNTSNVSLLSAVISFIPFIGNKLKDTIDSLDNLIKTQEMKNSAKRMKLLASSHVELYQIVSAVALEIIRDQTKINQIIKSDLAEQKEQALSFFAEFLKGNLMGNLKTEIAKMVKPKLFEEINQSAAAMLGNRDANELIQKWISKSINVEEASPLERQESIKKILIEAITIQNKLNTSNSQKKSSFNEKFKEGKVSLGSELNKLFLLDSTQKGKLMDYYEGFVLTFIETYTISQGIEDKKLELKSQDENIIDSTKRMKLIASDIIELYDLVNNSARDIIVNETKRKEITDSTDIEEEEEIPSFYAELLNGNSADTSKKEVGLIVGPEYYNKTEKSLPTRLGNSDANKLIQKWISKSIDVDMTNNPEEKKDLIRRQFTDIITLKDQPDESYIDCPTCVNPFRNLCQPF